MKQGTIGKTELGDWIGAVAKEYRVYGPVRDEDGVSLSEITGGAAVDLDFTNTKLSPKNLFFPQCEAICAYGEGEIRDVPPPDGKVVVFGMRPCDASALSCLEAVFGAGEFVDPYYRRRRDNTVVISMACRAPEPTCFCTSVGGSPAGKKGADVLATDLDDALLFEACSEKGVAFLEAYSGLLKEPGEAALEARAERAAAAENKILPLETNDIRERLEQAGDSPIWSASAQRCLGCGVCTYLCPTCHCFAFFDDASGSRGTRTKNWDSCMFPAFTLEASGHNPRRSQGDRMRQRVMHKFRYAVENAGEAFCVGCGRCVRSCPVNADIREIITEIGT